jgi:glutamine amidotransferase-like uncharacterized protein
MNLSFIILLLVGLTACNSPGSLSVSSLNLNTNVVTSSPSSSRPPIVAKTPNPPPAQILNTGSVGLVWDGDGACAEDCALASANAVEAAGLSVRYVNQNTVASTIAEVEAVFADARVWVMPGGYASTEVSAIPPAIKTALVKFVAAGGGYVGWCAGAFAATSSIGTIGKPGLGIFPGSSDVYTTRNNQNSYGASIEKLTWFNGTRNFYLEGGPFLKELPSSVEVVGRYDDQVSVAAARTTYGNGRVFITGVHPEAPSWWWSGTSISDADGSDEAYATDMIKWAAKLE